MPLRIWKQSERLAATLYSPPETWISNDRALRNGTTPGSSRCTSAPSARKSSSHGSLRTWKSFMAFVKEEMPETGLEPARSCDHQALNLARLPIPPLRRWTFLNVGSATRTNQGGRLPLPVVRCQSSSHNGQQTH